MKKIWGSQRKKFIRSSSLIPDILHLLWDTYLIIKTDHDKDWHDQGKQNLKSLYTQKI